MGFCPQCGSGNQDDARFCEKCGGSLSEGGASTSSGTSADQVIGQTKVMLEKAGGALGKLNPKLLIPAVVVVLVLLVGFNLLRPMSERDYERAAEDAIKDLSRAQGDLSEELGSLAYNYDDFEDRLDERDVERAREEYEDQSKEIKAAARALGRLRPPSTYKREDEDLRAYADLVAGDQLKGMESLIDMAEEGDMTYEDFEGEYEDFWEGLYEDNEDVYDDFSETVGDMEIDQY